MDWDQIWQKKANEHVKGDYSLEEILRVNGYDVAYAATGVDTIFAYTEQLIKILNLSSNQSLLEVGCGAGAIAMPMIKSGIKVTGIDRNADLIDIAVNAMPDGEFHVGDAADFDLPNKSFDAALSQGVFQFFPSQQYGIDSISNMISHVKEGAVVAVTDLLDEENKGALMEERIRLLGEEEFQKKYVDTGLDHQFYDRNVLSDGLSDQCSELRFESQVLDNATASYKFNLIIKK